MKLEVSLFCTYLHTILVQSAAEEWAAKYYMDLIDEGIERAYSYRFPKNSYRYLTYSNRIVEYGVFDYIIVGAGSAGAVIASRLSENWKYRVLLLEAGGRENAFTDIPGMDGYLQGLEYNWGFNSTPQEHACQGMTNRECAYPRGKALGGSSVINGAIYARGNKIDFDRWFEQGNPGWSYKDVLPFFIKSENSEVNGDKGYHGTGGYLNVAHYKDSSPQLLAFFDANIELGRKVLDFNGENQLGVGRTQFNLINNRRDSVAKAFLEPAKYRRNLKILPFSLVTRILINAHQKRAYGVLFSHAGVLFRARATREVIVSAGSIGSPQLLMLSGIGPKEHLHDLKIPLIKDLAVGQNFQDHPCYFEFHVETNYTEPSRTQRQNVEDFLNGFGRLTIPGNVQGLGFFQTKYAKIDGYPDIEMVVIPSENKADFVQHAYHYTDETFNGIRGNINTSRTFTLTIVLLHPKSVGTVTLKSNNPYEYPLIDPRFLSDPKGEDIATMYEGVQLALEIINTTALQKLDARFVHPSLPACKHHEYLSREFWYCQLQQLTTDVFHSVGTCKMGPDPNKGAVVNHELKVHGVKGLRVADASIMPETTSGHTHAPSVMIGEKAAYMILNNK